MELGDIGHRLTAYRRRTVQRGAGRPGLTRRRRGGFVALVVASLACAGLLAGLADATTGPGYLLRPPKYLISNKVLNTITGRYLMTSAAHKSKIQSSELYIGVAESGYAAGGISIYSYDPQGQLQSFAATLYDFHVVRGGQIESDIVGSGGEPILGHLFIRHVGSTKNLTGSIDPPYGGGPFAIAYRYKASSGPLPGAAYSPVSSKSSAPKAPPKPKPGWGKTGDFLGRYHLTPGQASATPTPAAGIFTIAATAADRLMASESRPTGGQLTLFMRTVKKTEPPEPSGILSVDAPSGNTVIYLTNLTSVGDTHKAIVNGGSFLGPPIGSFSGTISSPGSITGKITATGLGKFNVKFARFSSSPVP